MTLIVWAVLVALSAMLIVLGVRIFRSPDRIRAEQYPRKLAASTQPMDPGEALIAQQLAVDHIRWGLEREARLEMALARRPLGILLIVLAVMLIAAWTMAAWWLARPPPRAGGPSAQAPNPEDRTDERSEGA